jgi:MFS family permease
LTEDAPVRLLREPDFRRYLAARGLSVFGTIVTLIALPVLVYRLTDSASLTALVAALEATPYLLFGLLAGALGDRWDRRRVMVSADLLAGVVVATVPLAHWLDVLTVPHVLAVAFLSPALGVFFDGATFGALPTLVGRDRIAQANSYVWSLQGAAEVIVPGLVGIALAVFHPATLLLVDAVSFVASAALVAVIRGRLQEDRQPAPFTLRRIGAEIGEGVRYLARHAGIRSMTIVGFTQCLAGGGFVALMVVWSDRQLDIGTEGIRFGIVYGSWAVGGVIASMSLPRILRRGVTPARITLLALPVSALIGVITPLWTAWWAGALSLFAWSLFYTTVVVNSISYRQQVTPEHLLGRVNTAGRMLSWGLGWTGGAFLAGALAGGLGVRNTMLVMTAISFVGVAVAWTSPLRAAVVEPTSEEPAPAT